MKPRRRRLAHDRQGFALLATLWLSVAIAALSLSFALEARHDRLAVANLAERGQASAAARAGIATALSRLDRLTAGTAPAGVMPVSAQDPWQWADTLISERMVLGNGASYEVHVQDLGAYIDINNASEDQWRDFFTALDIDYDKASHLAQAIADWSDYDDDPRANGAERDAYLQAGRLVLPTNHQFASVNELRDVMGMTPDIFRRAAPYLSVNGFIRVNVNTAPIPVLRVIPQFTDDVISLILSQRSPGTRISSMQELTRLVGGRFSGANTTLANLLAFSTDMVFIKSVGYAPGGHTKVEATTIAIRAQPIATVGWRMEE